MGRDIRDADEAVGVLQLADEVGQRHRRRQEAVLDELLVEAVATGNRTPAS
jgi:hypothetical protein